MNYRYLALDLDGTLVNSQKVITPATYEALMKIQENGAKVILCSGRPMDGILALARQLKLKDFGGYIISFNGGRVVSCATGEIVFQREIAPDELWKVFHYAKEFKTPLLMHQKGSVLAEYADNEYIVLEAKINHMPVRKVDDLSKHTDEPIIKFIAVEKPDYLATVEPKMREALGPNFHVMRSEPFFLEIMAKDIEKSYALDRLLETLGDTKDALVACGDGFNDISMIEYAGMGVAMANAQPAVKDVANFITRSNDDDGIALVCEMFFSQPVR